MDPFSAHRSKTMGRQPPPVASRPNRSQTLLRNSQGQSARPNKDNYTSVSQLKSKLFGEGSSSAPPSPLPSSPLPMIPPPVDSFTDEEYDDVRNVVIPLRKVPSFKGNDSSPAPPPIARPQLRPPLPTSAAPPPPPRGDLPTPLKVWNASQPSPAASPFKTQPLSILSDAVPLVDFMRRYKQNLPQKIRIHAGFRGTRDKASIFDGEVLYLLCQINSQVVVVTIVGEKAQVTVPVNSGAEFGILYNPEGDYNKAFQGYQFETVGQILAMPYLPSVVCAKQSFSSGTQESSVNANDILLIREVVQKSFGQAHLSCVNAKTNESKNLPEACCGWFTTSPYEACIYLHQVVEHLRFPLECLALYSAADAQQIRSRLPRSVLKLEKSTTESSVVASRPSTTDLLSIPLRLGIEVQQVQLAVDESKKLADLTKSVFDGFNPAKVHPVVPSPGPRGEGLEVLCELVNPLNPNVGLDLVKPPSVPTSKPWQSQVEPPPSPEGDDEPEYDIPDVAMANFRSKMKNDHQLMKTSEAPPTAHNPTNITQPNNLTSGSTMAHYDVPPSRPHQLTPAVASHVRGSMKPSNGETEVEMLRKEVTTLKQEVQNLQTFYHQLKDQTDLLQATVKLLEKATDQSLSPDMHPFSQQGATTSPESNRAFLASLSNQQVLHILKEMNMDEYHPLFARQQINGEILSRCNDQILQQELQIKSKLHRIRLMGLINGQTSVRHLLDPYVKCYKQ